MTLIRRIAATQNRLRILSFVTICLACSACDMIAGLTAPRIGGRAPLLTNAFLGAYDWSSDSRTIFYTGATGESNRKVGVWRLDAVTGRTYTVVPTLPGTSAMLQTLRVALPAAGMPEKLYVALNQDTWCSPGTVFRLPTDGSQWDTLATDVDNAKFASSNDGRHLSFTAIVFPPAQELCPGGRDSFVVMSTATAPAYARKAVERGISWGDIQPVSVSNGGSLVYARGGASPYTTLRLADPSGVSRELVRYRTFGADTNQVPSTDVVWHGEAPTLLFTRTVQGRAGADVYAVDASGTQSLVATIADAIGPTSLAQSTDGTSWAGWFVVADLTPNNVERHNLRYRLYAKTPDQADVRMLGEVEGYEGPWKLRVSPDGRFVSFLDSRDFYVLPMR